MKKNTVNKKGKNTTEKDVNNNLSGFGKVLINSLVAGIFGGIITYICTTKLNSFFVELLTKVKNNEIPISELIIWISVIVFILALIINAGVYVINFDKQKKSR